MSIWDDAMKSLLDGCHSAFGYPVQYVRPGNDPITVTAITLPDDAPESVRDMVSMNISFRASDFANAPWVPRGPEDRLTPMEDDEVTMPDGTVYRIGPNITYDPEGRIDVHMRRKS